MYSTYSAYVYKYIETLLQHVHELVTVISELDKALLLFSSLSSPYALFSHEN